MQAQEYDILPVIPFGLLVLAVPWPEIPKASGLETLQLVTFLVVMVA